MVGWVGNKKGRTTLGISKEEQKNDKMGTITGTVTIEKVGTRRSLRRALRT